MTDTWPNAAGEMAGRIRAHDWKATPLGPVEHWPQSLTTTVGILLALNEPAALAWGPEFIILYNDAYIDLYGNRDQVPSLGVGVRLARPEIWSTIGPDYEQVLRGGEPVRHESRLVPVLRHGRMEDICWTYSFNPVLEADAPHGVGGVLILATQRLETTAVMRASDDRQLFLAKLSDTLRPLADSVTIQIAVTRLLGEHLGANQVHYGEILADTGDEATIMVRQGYGNGLPPMAGAFRHRAEGWGERLLTTYRAGQTAVSRDVNNDPTISAEEAAIITGAGFSAYVAVPLLKAGAWVAVLAVHSIAPRAWKADEVALIEDVAERTWAAVERARAESQLNVSEERWRGLFERMNEGFALCEMVYGPDGEATDYRVIELNAAWERMVGQPGHLIKGQLISAAIPDLEPFWLQTYARVVKTGEPAHVEHEFAAIGRWFEVMAYRTEPGRFAMLFQDITERKQAGQRQSFLLKLSDALRPLADPQAIRVETCRLLGEELDADWVVYGLIDVARNIVDIDRGYAPNDEPPITGVQPLSAFGWTLSSYQAGTTIVVSDTQTSDQVPVAERPAMAGIEMTALISVPLLKNGVLVGALAVSQAVPRAWTAAQIELVEETAERIWEAIERARVEARLRQSEGRLQVLVHELQHRTRNLMGVVRSTAAKLLKSSEDLGDFAPRFGSRIDALARVQGLLSRLDEHDRVTFDELVRSELDAMGAPEDVVTLQGPSGVMVRSSGVQMLAMALHELATNALKYGALSQPGAHLTIRWRLEQAIEGGQPLLQVDWSETGVTMPPSTSAPGRRGQGRELIERALPYQLKAKTDFELSPDGVRCTIILPVSVTNREVADA